MSIITQYKLVRTLGLMNNILSVVLIDIAVNLPMAILFMKNFISASVPIEYEEAAYIDGCSIWGAFFRITELTFFQPQQGVLNYARDILSYGLPPVEELEQLSLFPEEQKAQRRTAIDQTVDLIRAKYGYFSIRRALTRLTPDLDLDAKGDHIIHPIGFLGTLVE